MSFIYHAAPNPMIGNKLIPLNAMPKSMIDIRTKSLEKYETRREILNREIPLLDCLWNDVLHFIPIHPQKIFELQRELGLIDSVPPYTFYVIDVANLNPDKTIVYFKNLDGAQNVSVKCAWLNDVNLAEYEEIPEETIKYYTDCAATGTAALNYQFVPHILHKGSLDITNVTTIALK